MVASAGDTCLWVGVQDYRAGVARADVEAEQRRQRRLEGRGGGADEEDSGRRQSARWEPMMEPATGQNADGSFSQAGMRLFW